MTYKFYGGVHPPTFKTLTSDRPIKRVYIPKKVTIPLSQHTGSPAEPVVAVGDSVKVGALIAKQTGFISSPVHAAISGKVTKISHSPTPTQGRALSISIESQGDEDQEFKGHIPLGGAPNLTESEALSKEELLAIIRDAGIVGLGGAAFPTYVKLSPPKDKNIDSVILNGAECEPHLTCDHRLLLEKSKEILKGFEIIVKILGVKDAYIAIEDNKLSAIYAMERAISAYSVQRTAYSIKIVKLETKYPQGAEKQVIKSVLNRTVPAGGLPMDVGCVVQNVGTAFAIYEAVYFGKPLIERCITITGSCVKEPMNLWVRIGTLLEDLKDSQGGFLKEPKRIVVGGPMMGIAQYTMDVPIVKGTSGVLFLSEDDIDREEESVCIRCGRCIDVCPMGLVPTTLMYHVKKERFREAKDLGIPHCYECGACAYICPAKIPLLDYMKLGKAMIHP
ncbi:MAG: electron transport complex subunit RsxC [Candidatus Omnitrophica bacterium]|nr:electron transport complex subunit RsxC [Candidatus Omnitrophota bacterium]